MKYIFSIIMFVVCAYSSPLTPDEAFKFSVNEDTQSFNINLNISKGVYLYKSELKIIKNNNDITNTFNFHQVDFKDNNEVFFNNLKFDFPKFTIKNNDNIKIHYQACSLDGLCYQPLVTNFVYEDGVMVLKYANKELRKNNDFNDYENVLSSSFFIALLTFFVYGLLLSLTPCTLPMVPIISSILVKNSGKNPIVSSIIYVLGMSISYTIIGIIAASIGSGVQSFFQNKYVIISFSLIFIILAFSMFGFYEIKIPSFITNKLNNKISKLSGILGIFFMGILSALIVGPCVAAPLAGLLIYIAKTNDILLGASTLFVMSIGMGIPLIAIGFGFKFVTGAWMQEINKFFAFVMLALAIFFLDRILYEEIINVLYAILGIIFVISFRLFESTKSKFRLCFKVVLLAVLAFCIILLYKTFNKQEISVQENLNFEIVKSSEELILDDKNIIYFTADWCDNCKIMSKTTFKDSNVVNSFKKFKLIKIDLTKPNDFEDKISKKYNIFGPPVIAIVNKDGTLLKQIIGLVDTKTLLKELEI